MHLGAMQITESRGATKEPKQPVTKVDANEIPYRSHTTCQCVGEQPCLSKEKQLCLAAYVTLNGMKAYALFDTGSTSNLMAPEFSFMSGSLTFKLTEEIPLQLGCKGS
jgi:hypothetical protein